MPRRTASEKAETHKQIVRHAARAFRERGSGVGIVELMSELEMTHGGFYRHFENKEALLGDAISLAFDEIAERMHKAASNAPEGRAVEAMITAYFSHEHLKHPESWCALATLAPDLARQPVGVRKKVEASMQAYVAKIAPFMPGSSAEEKQAAFLILFSAMSGAMALVRTLSDQATRERTLAMFREHYVRAYARET